MTWVLAALGVAGVGYVAWRVSRAPAGTTVWEAVFPPAGVAGGSGAAQPSTGEPHDPFLDEAQPPYGTSPGV